MPKLLLFGQRLGFGVVKITNGALGRGFLVRRIRVDNGTLEAPGILYVYWIVLPTEGIA